MSGTRGAATWLRFEVGSERCALPIEAVVQVIGLRSSRPAGVPGWVGLVALSDGSLPVADGAALLERSSPPADKRALVLRGRVPLGVGVDAILGLTTGAACPLAARIGLPTLATAAIPAADGPTLVLDADATWRRVWTGLEVLPSGAGFRLKPLARERVDEAPTRRSELSEAHTRVLVYRAGLDADLAVPADAVLAVGPEQAPRPLSGGPKHLAGLLSWRGRLVPLIDVPARLGRELDGQGRTLYLALTGRATRALALRVGEVVGPAEVPPDGGPATDLGLPSGWVRATARLGPRSVAILDPGAMVAG